MPRSRTIRLLGIAAIVLLAFSSTSVTAECTTKACCWDELEEHLEDCDDLYGDPKPDPNDEVLRKMALKACGKGAGTMFLYCFLGLPPEEMGPIMTFNEGSMFSGNDVAGPPEVYSTEFQVLPSVAGTYLLRLNNGMKPDADDGRAAVMIRLDGNVIVTTQQVNGTVHGYATTFDLSAGVHTIEFSLWRDNVALDWGMINAAMFKVSE